MSGLGNAEFVVSLDTSQLIAGTDKAKQTFKEMSDAGLQSMNTIQVESDKTSGGMGKIGDAAQKSSEKIRASFSSAIAPITGLASSSASLYFSFNNLENASIRVEQAHLRVQRAQKAVNDLIDKGKQGTDEYNLAMQNLQIQQEKYDNIQQNVTQNLVYMGLSITTLATSTIPSAIKAIQGLQITQEEFAIALEATMPWLLAITGAVLAWEYAISPLIKSQTGLDLGIQSNIEKLVAQHSQLTTTTSSFNDLTGTLGTTDGALAGTTSSFDTLGDSITATSGKLSDMMEAFREIQTGGVFSTKGVSLLAQNDTFTQAMAQIDQTHQIEGDIQKLMDGKYSLQDAINITMEHSLTILKEEAFQYGYSNEQLQKKVDLLNKAKDAAVALLETTKLQTAEDQKKAKLAIATDLSKQLGISPELVLESFDNNVGAAYNSKLDEIYQLGQRNFGSVWESQNQALSRGRPFVESVGNSISNAGINTSSAIGGLKNDDFHNMLVELVANTHFFGENYGRDKDLLRIAINEGEALQQDTFEQNNPQWQKFYALRNAGLFTGDPNLSLEDNLGNAEKAYEAIFTGLRPDVASALRAANEQSYSYRLYADARSPGIAVTRYNFEIPTKEALDRAIADSRFASEEAFQSTLKEAETVLGQSEKNIIDTLANPLTSNDIQAEIEYKKRLEAMSSGSAF